MADEVVRDILEEMVEKAALEMHDQSCTCEGSARCRQSSLYPPGVLMQEARAVLSAALAGRTAVELIAPTADGDYESGYSSVWVTGHNQVASAFGSLRPEHAESYAVALLSAARDARRRASGSGVGDQDGE